MGNRGVGDRKAVNGHKMLHEAGSDTSIRRVEEIRKGGGVDTTKI